MLKFRVLEVIFYILAIYLISISPILLLELKPKNLNLANIEEKMARIVSELGTDPRSIPPPNLIRVIKWSEFKQLDFSTYRESTRQDIRKLIQTFTMWTFFRFKALRGIYISESRDIYLISEYAEDDTLIHELTHHVINMAIRGADWKKTVDNDEEITREVTARLKV